MQLQELKDYIRENNCIETILGKIGCHSFRDNGKEVRCARPDHDNKSSISVNKETLFTRMYTSDDDVKGDIFSLIMKLKNIGFGKSVGFVHSIYGLEYKYESTAEKEKPVSAISALFQMAEKNAKSNKAMEPDLKFYDESILENYIIAPNIWFFRENILQHTQDKFNIGYCPERSRVVIPIRYWQGEKNSYIGVFSRTVLEDWEILGLSKYLPLIPYPKSMNLYGLNENLIDIKDAGEVIVFEAEKSVLKADTMKIFNTVAVGSHELSNEHISILMSLCVNIVIAYDKDISEEFAIETCKRFNGMRNVSYIFDDCGFLGEKDSPVDQGLNAYNILYSSKKDVYKELDNEYIKV